MTEFIFGNEDEVVAEQNNSPITTAFVIVESKKGYMLLYNKYRHLWELTGGMIEQGESLRSCAIRECKEESNQDISDLKFIALAKYLIREEIQYSAIYYSFLEKEKLFVENSEIKKLCWWDGCAEVKDMCAASIELLKLYNPAL